VDVRIETVEVDDDGSRQISPRRHVSELLQQRRADIHAAIAEAVSLVEESVPSGPSTPDDNGWRVSRIQASFGITLAAEAGVIISKASSEASLLVTVTITRT
jgi:hypothetical protein